MMKIRLQIRLSDNITLEGEQLNIPLPEAQQRALLAMPYLAGTVWIEHDNQQPIEILDDLEYLVPRLCMLSHTALAEVGRPVAIDMFISRERVMLVPEINQVRVTTTWQAEALLPKAEFIAELGRVGHQFIRFLEINLGSEPVWQEKINNLRLALKSKG